MSDKNKELVTQEVAIPQDKISRYAEVSVNETFIGHLIIVKLGMIQIDGIPPEELIDEINNILKCINKDEYDYISTQVSVDEKTGVGYLHICGDKYE